jgi:hypothetical protein
LRILRLDRLAQPRIGLAQRCDQRLQLLGRGIVWHIGHKPP